MMHSDTIGKVMDALRQAQLEFDPVLKDARNPLYNSKYAELSNVIAATQPTLAKYGLVISQLAASDLEHQGCGITTLLAHSSGEFISSLLLLPAIGYGKKGKGDTSTPIRYDAQTACGAITYARRYAYLGIIGVAAQDDDGNQGSGDSRATSTIPEYNDYSGTEAMEPPAPTRPEYGQPGAAEVGYDSQVQVPPMRPTPAQVPSNTAPDAGDQSKQESASNAVASNIAREPGDSDEMPSEEEMQGYRQAFAKLKTELEDAGLDSKGAPVGVKVRIFLQSITKTANPNDITRKNWEDFFMRAASAKAKPNGLVGLVKLVNKANGIEK